MTSEPNNPAPIAPDDAEPRAERSPAPILLIGLFALLVFWGFAYLDKHGGGFDGSVYMPYDNALAEEADRPVGNVDPRILGQRIFAANCTPCHQASGLGLPGQFPPVAGSEWVNAKGPNRIIRAVLNGLAGPITVKGQPFSNTMVPWKATMKDEDIANVLTFVRQNKEWGNDASAVTPEEVAAIREKIKGRDTPFTPDELLKLPDTEETPAPTGTPAAPVKVKQ